jgi:hypothetical protein
MNVTSTTQTLLGLNQYSITTISLALGIYKGSWGYKIPIYVSLNDLDVAPSLVFRFTLPLGFYIKQNILSPSLEDLVIVDSENNPLPYLVSHFKDSDYAIVYVKYPKFPSSTTFTFYMYLCNKVLWGSGNSYQSLSTFDLINPSEPLTFKDVIWNYTTISTFGIYNYFVFKNYDKLLFASTPTDGIVLDPRNGSIIEYHGTYKRTYTITPIIAVNDISVLIRGSKINVYADGTPNTQIDLADFFPQNVSTSIWYIGWSGTSVYVSYSTFYSYSIGNIIGSQSQAPRTTIQNPYAPSNQMPVQMTQIDFWGMMPLLVVILILAIAMRLMKGGISSGKDMLSRL